MSAISLGMKVDARQAVSFLQLGAKSSDYALANALNNTAKAIQRAQQANVRRRTTVRKPDFIERQVAVIKPFASAPQRRLSVTVSIAQKQRLLLAPLETGGPRPSSTPGKAAAVPVTGEIARPTFPTAQTYPPLIRRLGLRQRRRAAKRRGKGKRVRKSRAMPGAIRVLQGARRTFALKTGVFRRVSKDVVKAVVLFLRPQLRPQLHWHETAQQTAREFPRHLKRELADAFAHRAARG